MTTVAVILDRVKNRLYGAQREPVNVVNGGIDAVTTSLVYTDAEEIPVGALIEVGTETLLVRANNTGTKTLTVVRGYRGSTAAAISNGALIRTRPIFFSHDLLTALNEELYDLSSPLNGLYKVSTVDITYNSSTVGYDLTSVTDLIDVTAVRWEDDNDNWPTVKGWQLLRNMPTDEFASGFCLRVRGTHDGSPPTAGRTMRVFYRAPYTIADATSRDLTTYCGVHAEAEDIVVMGTMLRIGANREIGRNFFEVQGDSRRSEEVPQGAVANSFRVAMAMRQQRIQAEAARLDARWRTAGR